MSEKFIVSVVIWNFASLWWGVAAALSGAPRLAAGVCAVAWTILGVWSVLVIVFERRPEA